MELNNGLVPQKKRPGRIVLIVLLALLAVLAAAYFGFCYYLQQNDIIWNGSITLGQDLGGLTVAQAAEKLDAALPDTTFDVYFYDEAHPETAGNSEPELTIALSALKAEVDTTGLAQALLWENLRGPFWRLGWDYLHYPGIIYGAAEHVFVDESTVSALADRLAAELSSNPRQPIYRLDDRAVTVRIGKDGRTIDPDTLRTALMGHWRANLQVHVPYTVNPAKTLTAQEVHNALSSEMTNAAYDPETDTILPDSIGVIFDPVAAQELMDSAEPGQTVSIPALVKYPTITAAQLREVLFRDVLGEARTRVTGTAARRNNVALSSAAFDDTVLLPGETFSYNGTVGQRTVEKGYQAAPAYIAGETVDEIGGGVCQPSSTLYLACLRANMEITERHPHRYVSSYIEKGMDATVSWGGPDYKFTNNTDYPVKIITIYEGGYLTVRLFGTNVDGTYATMSYEQLGSTPWETEYVEDPTLPPGQEEEKVSPYTGYQVKTYQTIHAADGTVLDRHLEATSNYKVRNKVIARGPALPTVDPEPLPDTPTVPIEPDAPAEPSVPAAGTVPGIPAEPEI